MARVCPCLSVCDSPSVGGGLQELQGVCLSTLAVQNIVQPVQQVQTADGTARWTEHCVLLKTYTFMLCCWFVCYT